MILGRFRIAALTSSGQVVGATLSRGLRVRMTVEFKPFYTDELEAPPQGRVSFEDYCRLKAKSPDWEVWSPSACYNDGKLSAICADPAAV